MVERDTARDLPAWTIGRTLGWALAGTLALFVTGVAVGMLVAHLERRGGAGGEIVRFAVPLFVTAVIGVVAWLALRRSWPARPNPGADAWQLRAAARARRTTTAWAGTIAALTVAGIAVPVAARLGIDTDAGLALLIAGIAFGAIGMVWGTVVYMRVIDEQERQANFLACYAGLMTYMTLFIGQMLLATVKVDLPRLDHAIFGVTMIVALSTFIVARFR